VDQDDVRGLTDCVLERLPLEALPLTFLRQASPTSGEGYVAVTRETILRFSVQLAEDHGLDADSLYAEFGGERLATRIHISPERKTVTLFYDEPLPPNARIRVTLVGDAVQDYQSRNIDGDGVAEGALREVSTTESTDVRFLDSVTTDFLEFGGVVLTVPTDSLFSDDGNRGGQVGIAPVDPNRLPGTLPQNLNFPLVITVQTDGVDARDWTTKNDRADATVPVGGSTPVLIVTEGGTNNAGSP
jgi:hypothetical protein